MAIPRTATSNEVYLLHLNDDGSPRVHRSYVYIDPQSDDGFDLRFSIEGTSPICRHGSLWINIPEKGAVFKRDEYREHLLAPDFNRSIEINVPIYRPGVYTYYLTYSELPDISDSVDATLDRKSEVKKSTLFNVIVAPRLHLNGRRLPLDALSVFTVLSKSMGVYPENWEPHLRSISDRGYNMVHFPPLQVRGSSNSPYSIADQLAWDPYGFPGGELDLEAMILSLEEDYSMLALTDIVLNHTSPDTVWLKEHPEAGYNLVTAPWLESAMELDQKLQEISANMEALDLPADLKSEDDLIKVMNGVKSQAVVAIRLWEYYALDVDRDADAAIEAWVKGDSKFPAEEVIPGGIDSVKKASLYDQAQVLIKYGLHGNDRLGERFRRKVDAGYSSGLISVLLGEYKGGGGPDKVTAREKIRAVLDEVNMAFYKEYDNDVGETLQQLFNRIKYDRLDADGPRLGPISAKKPMVESYFTRIPRDETTKDRKDGELLLVNNGWIWNANALVDNAGPNSKAYLRREVISWGDCVKLRYGTCRDDNPWLWDYMAEYSRLMAKYFQGFRIDNCHSTPIDVAVYMLDEARKVRPNLYVVAELFSGNEDTDYVFVKRLGLNSLIREAMQSWGTAELSRLVHSYGGWPIGSFEMKDLAVAPTDAASVPHIGALALEDAQEDADEITASTEIVKPVKRSDINALFMDCTHDNEVPAQKRDARDTLPNAALVGMCACGIGSVMGYDEIYPERLDLVAETRLYKPVKIGSSDDGIGRIKKIINQVHTHMGEDGYTEAHIHHEDQYITVHRVQPHSRKGYFLIAHTAFPGYGDGTSHLSPVRLPGTRARHLGSWSLEVDTSAAAIKEVTADKKFMRGLPSRVVDSTGVIMEVKGGDTVITVRERFPPGSIALFETWIPGAEHTFGLDAYVTAGAKNAFKELDLIDLNFLLYRCEAEERASSDGKRGVYEIPGHGKLVYAGLQGWWSVLKTVIQENNLGHPMCQNLREGHWAIDYIVERLETIISEAGRPRLAAAAKWLKKRFDALRPVPSFLLPRYFGLVVRTAYEAAVGRALEQMNQHIRDSQWFVQSLALVSVQQTGMVKSASLYPDRLVPSLAAGLPHFAVEWARCWGRDVFISLRGLFLCTGRYAEAREHIMAFASVMKHGLIPNLLGSGKLPRYNARDAVWFFLQNVQDYVRIVPDGIRLLEEKVERRFLPYDDTWFASDDARAYSAESTIGDIVQEALQRHAEGIKFREHNAGPELDRQMSDEGFNVEIEVDWTNGFVFGGNQHNCGTWMDKMGESEKAGSKGVPGTPRDGAAVEITGLLYSTLAWVAELHTGGQYRYPGVKKADGTEITFKHWAQLVRENFERCYFVPVSADEDGDFDVDPRIVNRRGIYKDLYRSGKPYEDYQLRPNFPIAMAVAPDLFTPSRALRALAVADKALRGPTGMATLDPLDLNYRPYYVNSEDSKDFATAKGRNYHQGPEWVWPTGFFLRALLRFDLERRGSGDREADREGRTEAFQQVTRRLVGCKEMIKGEWAGLAELTQKAGEFCPDSCPTQAWSAGCLVDLYMDAAEAQGRSATADVPTES
ncbi:probable 4-alpha-glucanotransferase / amylo-1,6-glucosidase (glycogen-debranching enzyme) [Cephalotrichum gorgonifer]|uniref:Glycogen debranching enzyme n=1 Tax=Cephalotrichum gorgonifer TaxID=2041049 RepID=A0AAE8SQL7_9PEZI|nr:probable 4-alpha-glucanotransferase / amylo-1,6-glucosidase (glycogen-debranching enzyme) [Cephalotrichum gorgonifer]